MRSLGIRAEPKQISFVVFCSANKSLLCVDTIAIPKMLEVPEQLKYIRNNILDVLREYKIEFAALRVAEGIAKNQSITRYYLEAVIQEAFSSSNVTNYQVLRMNTIIKNLKINKEQYDLILESKSSLLDIDNSEFKKVMNEAFMASIAAVNHA
ncbi:MAG: hypothetical protein E6995_14755 [Enterobacteriaceae bacterium]|uniref:hypothetical protein n=1 Tax=Hafnia paralvei TaxID=546367 RepID=UPI000EE9A8C3|nr:hypothetical protein [Hafnia paralvei]MDU1193389.1 hypothetical protein [Enterobacteriaceae bacterium]MDU1245484.1 hypothetical protein [Enterobacteriaceae bacterium]TBM31242.1 hypothetical protein EYY85_03495 [Hafnia paralvei]HCU14306.1 hypothetical protein [Hafnia paralvei]